MCFAKKDRKGMAILLDQHVAEKPDDFILWYVEGKRAARYVWNERLQLI